MVNPGAQFQSGGATSHFINNFTGNTISPSTPSIDSKHSIFSASIVDRHAFASKGWILDTGATVHIVHSIPHLTTITFVINTIAHLPLLETALVTHKSTVKLSETLILTGVLVFNLISISHLTKSLFAALSSFLTCALSRTLLIGA